MHGEQEKNEIYARFQQLSGDFFRGSKKENFDENLDFLKLISKGFLNAQKFCQLDTQKNHFLSISNENWDIQRYWIFDNTKESFCFSMKPIQKPIWGKNILIGLLKDEEISLENNRIYDFQLKLQLSEEGEYEGAEFNEEDCKNYKIGNNILKMQLPKPEPHIAAIILI
jgi:hypothetical protein